MLLIIGALLWVPIFVHPGVMMHGDLALPLTLDRFIDDFYPLWDAHGSFTNIDEIDRLFVVLPGLLLARTLHLSMGVYMTIFLFIFFECAIIAPIFLLKMIRRDGAVSMHACLAAGLIYALSPWGLYRLSAPYFYVAYALSPWYMYAIYRFIKDGGVRWWAGACALFAACASSPQYTIFTALLTLVPVALAFRETGWVASLRRSLLLGLGTIAGCLYWILPILAIVHISVPAPGYARTWSDVVGLSVGASPFATSVGYDQWVPWWKQDLPSNGVFWVIFWCFATCIPLAALAGSVVAVYRRLVGGIALTLMALIAYLLALGAHGPFPLAYRWLVLDAPFASLIGWVFRAPEKFGAYLWLAYAPLAAIAIDAVPKGSRVIRIAAVAVIALAFVPVSFGTLWDKYVPIKSPPSYGALNVFLSRDPRDVHVLQEADYSAPTSNPSGDISFTWAPGRMGGFVTLRSYPKPAFGDYHFTNPFAGVYSTLVSADVATQIDLMRDYNIGYVVLENDVVGGQAWFADMLRRLKTALKTVYSSRDFHVFAVPVSVPHLIGYRAYAVGVGGVETYLEALRSARGQLRDPIVLLDQDLRVDRLGLFNHASVLVALPSLSTTDVALDLVPQQSFSSLGAAVDESAEAQGWARTRIGNVFDDTRYSLETTSAAAKGLPSHRQLDFNTMTAVTGGVNAVCRRVPGSGPIWLRVMATDRQAFSISRASSVRRYDALDRGVFHWYRAPSNEQSNSICVHGIRENVPLFINMAARVSDAELARLRFLVAAKKRVAAKDYYLVETSMPKPVAITILNPGSATFDVHAHVPLRFVRLVETYDPYWGARTDSEEVGSVPVNYDSDGFLFLTAAREVHIRYLPQEMLSRYLWLLALPILLSVLFIVPIERLGLKRNG